MLDKISGAIKDAVSHPIGGPAIYFSIGVAGKTAYDKRKKIMKWVSGEDEKKSTSRKPKKKKSKAKAKTASKTKKKTSTRKAA